jgi:hypothetical protein
VRLARAEQHAVGHDGGAAAALLEHAQDERHEEQLGLLGLDRLRQRRVDVAGVEAALERRVGQDDVEAALGLLANLSWNELDSVSW